MGNKSKQGVPMIITHIPVFPQFPLEPKLVRVGNILVLLKK